MLRTTLQALRGDRGAVSILAAVSIVPMIAAAGLMIDSGSAWILKGQLGAATDAAAAVVAMHRSTCADGQVLPSNEAETIIEAALGTAPSEVVVTCTDDGVLVMARIGTPTSVMAIVFDGDITLASRARVAAATDDDNDAGGWSRP